MEIPMKQKKLSLGDNCRFAVAVIAILVCVAHSISAQVETVLHRFTGGADGFAPNAITVDNSGDLFGTTYWGGNNPSCTTYGGCGVVFEMVQSPQTGEWSQDILYSFSGGSDGGNPNAPLMLDSSGNVYGSTYAGGATNLGAIFELSPPAAPGGAWTESVLYSFVSSLENSPTALLFDPQGNIYGQSCAQLQANGDIFELSAPSAPGGAWSYNIIYSFPGFSSGVCPKGEMALDKNGNLYGSTFGGGYNPQSAGVIFELDKPEASGEPWTEHVLYRFGGQKGDGASPTGVIFHGGKIYGTTQFGGDNYGSYPGDGTVFQLTPPTAPGSTWTEMPILTFNRNTNGFQPMAGVVFDSAGNLYGTTAYNPTYEYDGEVFELSPPTTRGGAWTLTMLHTFTGNADGGDTYAGVVIGKGSVIDGTTINGGNAQGNSGDGVVFKILH
jgi:uncharacterized repeat protein (TIGR03803 family)